MSELRDVKAAASPHETLLVVDAMSGQDAALAATAFHAGLGLTGAVLTKLDGDARGGAALSVRAACGCVRCALCPVRTPHARAHPWPIFAPTGNPSSSAAWVKSWTTWSLFSQVSTPQILFALLVAATPNARALLRPRPHGGAHPRHG